MIDDDLKDAGSSAANLETDGAEPAELRQQVTELKQQLAEAQTKQLYERAEIDNFKRRLQKEKADSLRYAIEPLVRELLPIVDNLERALEHSPAANNDSLKEGVQLVLKLLHETLARHGVSRIDAAGQPFDPNRHEAIAQIASDRHPANHVADQHLTGYLLHDRLLRPAMVSVSSGKSQSAVESGDDRD